MSDRACWMSKLGFSILVTLVCCVVLTASAHAQTTIFSDDFEDAFTGWTEGGTPDWYTGTPKNGTHSIQLRKTESIERTISTVGYENISVSFYMGAHSLDNANENVEAHWYDGSGWSLLKRINNGDPEEDKQLHYFEYSLPSEADKNPDFALRFKINGSGNYDFGYVDDVIVEGTSTGGGPSEVVVYPNDWQTYTNASVTITSGSIADVHDDDDVYWVAQCNTGNQDYSMEYTWNTSYTPEDVTKITVEYQGHCTRSDTPAYMSHMMHSDGSSWTQIKSMGTWSTSDQWFTWKTTDVSTYMQSDGTMVVNWCGCSQNSNNYSQYTDVMRIRLELVGGGPEPPVADFSGSPTSGVAPLTVNFADLSTNGPTSWDWDFGDGGSSTAQNPSHQYTSASDYTVTLTVSNDAGEDTETKTNYISVTVPAPVADFSGNPLSGTVPLTVYFTDLSTNNPTSWDWTFGDGGSSTAQNPSHQYTSAGDYTVSLTATNAGGQDTETKSNYISVTPPAPVADFSGSPTSGDAPLTVNFTDLSTNSPTSWNWTFGDGGSTTAQNPSHQYASAGDYTVSLTAGNAGGQDTETKSNYISVTGAPSEVVVYPNEWQTYTNASVTVTSGSIADVHDDDDVYWVAQCNTSNQDYSMEYTWNTSYTPEDVTKITVEYQGHCTRSDTPAYMSHIMHSNGSSWTQIKSWGTWSTSDQWFTWETTDVSTYMQSNGTMVVNWCGCSQNSSNYSQYTDVMRIRLELTGGGPQPPVADFSGSPTSGLAPLTVNFTDLCTNSPTSWDWTFGDGGSSTAQNPSHQYTDAGDYTVGLTATNAAGQDTETKSDYISVTTGNIVYVDTVSELVAAVNDAETGDTIMVADGTYQLSNFLFLQGTTDVTLRGESGDPSLVVLRGQGWDSMDDQDDILRLQGCANTTIAYLTFEEAHAYGIKLEDTLYQGQGLTNTNIHHCNFYNIGTRMIKGTAGDLSSKVDTGSIRHCHFENSKIPPTNWYDGGDYITAIDCMILKDWVIADNYFKNIRGAHGWARGAIFVWVECENVISERNTIVNCDRSICYGNPSYSSQNPTQPHNTGGIVRNNFIVVGADTGMEICWATDVKIYHNTILTDDPENGNAIHHWWEDLVNVHIASNIVRGQMYGDESGVTKENNLTSGIQDSWFTDVNTGNLHLTASATPAIDEVDRLADCTTDFDEEVRPSASGMTDIGADEY